ncbi:MAG: hypothetical protein ACTSPB_00670 [Candidatus Thorarchaeota archaeon]
MSKLVSWIKKNHLFLIMTGVVIQVGLTYFGWEFLYLLGGIISVCSFVYVSPKIILTVMYSSWSKKKVIGFGLLCCSFLFLFGGLYMSIVPEPFTMIFVIILFTFMSMIVTNNLARKDFEKLELYMEVLENDGRM